MGKITPFLWYDGQAAEAAAYYTSLFPDSGMQQANPMITNFSLGGQDFIAMNGGPMFKLNPSISLFVTCATEAEVNELWNKLSEGASVLMPLNKYDWSPRYGWLQDKFGLSWQLMLGDPAQVGQKIVPCMLFVGNQYGNGEAAIRLYTGIFPGSSVSSLFHYGPQHAQMEGKLMHGQFRLGDTVMKAMDGFGDHQFGFNEAFSFFIHCKDQEEVDYFWGKLLEGGGMEQQCGWLKDKFGVSWQVVPERFAELMGGPDRAKADRVMKALMGMKKINLQVLEEA
ncbi:VOC family protein [Flavihumibacter rivuli]|uniref:VOC family protein n=1 Tax=Flavihumibacter rivuli TaxID=2838156 RepID=UPI001BDE3AED|nr:VOC family protein [Flavihumibacter rivuli]ULQ57688.1 VOC family protein [Flavihumibacter rivuli]